jgi:predicted alpha/beta-fold hydrolase
MSLAGHLWTITPNLRHRLAPVQPPPGEPWSVELRDPVMGMIRLTGSLRTPPGARALLVIVHGLSGSERSHYVARAAMAADRAGLACLRLNLRGADGRGEDLYHAGLTADLHGALASPRLARFSAIYILGYSLGGHLALRYGTEAADPRVRRLGAICPPLDLEPCIIAIDGPELFLYRANILRCLAAQYATVAARRNLPVTAVQAREITSMREWDTRILAPRHGFASAEDYYEKASVGPRLHLLRVPAVLVAAEHDPMVPAWSVRSWLAAAPPMLTVHWVGRGGHVGFPPDLDLGYVAALGLEPQAISWLLNGDLESEPAPGGRRATSR